MMKKKHLYRLRFGLVRRICSRKLSGIWRWNILSGRNS